MKLDLTKYADMKICVAVSGGRDSMSLLHYLLNNGKKFGITLFALNCEHGIRGEESVRDSKFVEKWCEENGVPLLRFGEDCPALAVRFNQSVETAAREWRRRCYAKAIESGADAIATAHHSGDNAETVLFNIARGSSVSGATGICDCEFSCGGVKVKLIRPLIGCSRKDIDEYISKNGVPFVEDETNLSDDYTRNFIRHNVLPALEKAVPGAEGAIYRFSRLAAEDEDYFNGEIERHKLISYCGGAIIKTCAERAVFSRAAVRVLKEHYHKKDYTREIIDRLYLLQFAENSKSFEFLSLAARKEEGQISICEKERNNLPIYPFGVKKFDFCGIALDICLDKRDFDGKILKFDLDKIPENAVIRTRQKGDRFEKFGGGEKSLGDFFTDKKIPVRLREIIPLIADGSDILAVCGVEISSKIAVTDGTKRICYAYMPYLS